MQCRNDPRCSGPAKEIHAFLPVSHFCLTAQEASAIFRRKFIYEQLHTETKQGANVGPQRQIVASDKPSFASNTADATGKDKRTVERAAACGEALGDDLNDIAGTSLDKGVELDALAKMEPEERNEIESGGLGRDLNPSCGDL